MTTTISTHPTMLPTERQLELLDSKCSCNLLICNDVCRDIHVEEGNDHAVSTFMQEKGGKDQQENIKQQSRIKPVCSHSPSSLSPSMQRIRKDVLPKCIPLSPASPQLPVKRIATTIPLSSSCTSRTTKVLTGILRNVGDCCFSEGVGITRTTSAVLSKMSTNCHDKIRQRHVTFNLPEDETLVVYDEDDDCSIDLAECIEDCSNGCHFNERRQAKQHNIYSIDNKSSNDHDGCRQNLTTANQTTTNSSSAKYDDNEGDEYQNDSSSSVSDLLGLSSQDLFATISYNDPFCNKSYRNDFFENFDVVEILPDQDDEETTATGTTTTTVETATSNTSTSTPCASPIVQRRKKNVYEDVVNDLSQLVPKEEEELQEQEGEISSSRIDLQQNHGVDLSQLVPHEEDDDTSQDYSYPSFPPFVPSSNYEEKEIIRGKQVTIDEPNNTFSSSSSSLQQQEEYYYSCSSLGEYCNISEEIGPPLDLSIRDEPNNSFSSLQQKRQEFYYSCSSFGECCNVSEEIAPPPDLSTYAAGETPYIVKQTLSTEKLKTMRDRAEFAPPLLSSSPPSSSSATKPRISAAALKNALPDMSTFTAAPTPFGENEALSKNNIQNRLKQSLVVGRAKTAIRTTDLEDAVPKLSRGQ